MRLSKLTLAGFKSFADRTEFTFDEDITGVVGPNGCGKSNVVDAIKWVLGERSSKSLRGKEMIDVIFAGSAGRKPAGMAAVTLTFENPVIDASAEVVDLDLSFGDNPPLPELQNRDRQGAETTNGEAHTNGEAPASDALAPESPEPLLPANTTVSKKRRRGLPIEADTVEVERRLYRDGESQYLINSKRARLKDIRDLFLDTGIGADAYSIIEQGKVDAMLLASPQERRTIFEEAAGIAKYKQRRIEAQRKLERAQANLAVTREQLANTERRLRIVKSQAAKARKFKELDGVLRSTRTAIAFDQYHDLRQRLDALTSSLEQLEAARKEATERLAEVESAKQDAELSRHEFTQKHKELDESRLAARHAEQSASQRKALTERALIDSKRQSETDAARLADAELRIGELAAEAEEQLQAIAAASERLGDVDRQIEKLAEDRAAILDVRAEKQSQLSERRAAVANIDRERASLLASIESDRKREEGIREQVTAADSRRATVSAERARVEGVLTEAKSALDSRRTRLSDVERLLAEHDQRAASVSKGRSELAESVSALEQNFLRLDGRRATLQEMVQSRAGLGDAPRAVLAARDSGTSFTSVLAPLADLIQTDAAHAAAIESILGSELEAIVVESLPSSHDLATLTGRVTFIPLEPTLAPSEPPSPSEPRPSGSGHHQPPTTQSRANHAPWDSYLESLGATSLRSVVTARADSTIAPRVDALLDRHLAETYLVQDLAAAQSAQTLIPWGRFITRDGTVFAGGQIHAGPVTNSESSGLLQRRIELASLDTEVARLGGELNIARVELANVDADAAAISASQTDLRSRLAGEQRGMVHDQTRAEQLSSELARLDRDGRNAEEESRQHRTRLAKLEEDRARLRDRAEKLLALHEDQIASAKTIESELAAFDLKVDAVNEQATGLRVESSKLGEQLSSARREHRRVELAAEAADREKRDLEHLVSQSQSRLAEHERAIAEAAAQIIRAGEDAARLESQVAEVAAQVESSAARAAELGELLNSARANATKVERDWHGLEVSRRELEIKRENLEERTTQELEVDLAFEYVDYKTMLASGEVKPIDQAQAAAEVDALRDQIKSLGSVNLDALEEETQLEARNEELIKQVADIDDAAAKLTELIEKLNIASKERFGEVFKTVQDHFGGNSGMFRKLFGGGHAEVKLMPLVKEVETADGVKRIETDEIDLLESGVEVIARPPGKQPRSISQLSGGEKTLTAVALLLSIFQSKPSCFCILDEVDAALDEANVGRYCGVVREFTTHSHFIVITHNKKTMQAADRLYGITMQERGVSTRVSVKFDQVGKNGELNGHAAAASSNGAPSVSEGSNGSMKRGLAKMRKGEAEFVI
jgi:chromosome segregation protein